MTNTTAPDLPNEPPTEAKASPEAHPDTPELDELSDIVNMLVIANIGREHPNLKSVKEAKASLTRLLAKRELEGRIDELETTLNDMNIGDEFLTKPTQKNKGWNKVILARLDELREELGRYE